MDSIWVAHAVLVFVQFGFAGAYVLSKVALTSGIHPVVLAVYRNLVAVAALIPCAYFVERGQHPRIDLTTLALFVVLGATGIFGFMLLLLLGLTLATAALSSVVSITIPTCVFIISAVFGLEKINWRRRDGQAKVGGLISAVTGAGLMPLYRGPAVLGPALQGVHAGHHLSDLHMKENSYLIPILLYLKKETWQIGVIMFILAGLSFAIYTTLKVPTLKRYPHPISLTAFASIFGTLMLAMAGLLTIQDRSEWVVNQPLDLINILYLGLIPSAANYALQTWAVLRTGPVLVAAYSPVQIIVASCLSHFFLGESIYLGSVLGTLLIITGLLLITFGQIEDRKAAARPLQVVPTLDGLPPVCRSPSKLKEPLLG